MITPSPDEDKAYARAILDRLMVSYDDQNLLSLCQRFSKRTLTSIDTAGEIVANEIKSALAERRPWSLVRVGDGEGTVLAVADKSIDNEFALKYCKLHFRILNGSELEDNEIAHFSSCLQESISGCDVAGFRSIDNSSFRPAREWHESWNLEFVLGIGSVKHLIGILAARQFFERECAKGTFQNMTITSAWIHYGLLPYLDGILEVAPSVIVICGHERLGDEFRRRLGARLREFIVVPGEKSQPRTTDESHYRKYRPRIMSMLNIDLSETLVLIGAGLMAKIYCNEVKKQGGVAVDLGSVFDILANSRNRACHSQLDCDRFKWI